MKRCVKAHDVAGFGTIPDGSLWEDDSPYVLDGNADCFVDVSTVDPEPDPEPVVRKFGEKPGGDD